MAYTAIDHGVIRAIVADLPGEWTVDSTQSHGRAPCLAMSTSSATLPFESVEIV